jgi:hypothetical protein
MGLFQFNIQFDSGFPTVEEVQVQFDKQTGLYLQVLIEYHLNRLDLTYGEMMSLLSQDAPAVDQMQTDSRKLQQDQPTSYEERARVRDQHNRRLRTMSYLGDIKFVVSGFSEIDCRIAGKVITLEATSGKFYAIESLIKVLFDLGGKRADGAAMNSKRWKRLKKWEKYKWYNRPR